MTSWLRRLALGSLVLSVLPLGGCQLECFTITIPDFASKAVQGVWLWRLSTATGAYERDTQFTFGPIEVAAAGDTVTYSTSPAGGSSPVSVTTYITRDPAQSDQVTVQLIYSRTADPGSYRASTYNTAGDSPLTSDTVSL